MGAQQNLERFQSNALTVAPASASASASAAVRSFPSSPSLLSQPRSHAPLPFLVPLLADMNHAVLLLLLLLPLAPSLRAGSPTAPAPAATITAGVSNTTSCAAQESCGNLTIRYPFSLSGVQPLYCGYPVFDLVCDAGRAYLNNTIKDRLFRVAEMDYYGNKNNTLVAAVQTTFAGSSDCPIPDFNVSSALALFPLAVSAANKYLVFFYNCAVPTHLRLPQGPCANHTIGAYLSDRPGDPPPQGVLNNCSTASVPVLRHGMQPAHQHYEQLISDGFLLELLPLFGDCDACRANGGECRFVELEFQCICSDGRLCPNSTQSNSTQSNSTSRRDKDELGIKIAAGITTVVLLLTILGIVCLLKLRNRRRSKRQRSASLDNLIRREGTPVASLRKEFSLAAGSPGTHIFTYEELHEATDGFSDAREIGVGGFGTVYKGTLPDGSLVAVKRLYKNSYKGVEQFLNEVELLSRLRHPNLVTLYGCNSSGTTAESARYRAAAAAHDLLLVYEFVPNGTLAGHLHGPGLLAWPARLAISVETASALDYLHARQVVHRDVKTSNILLDGGFHVKVADFGLSRLFPADGTYVSTAPQGTPGYVDPVYHRRYQLTDKSDVYSFGVVLVELISSRPAVDMSRAGADVNLACMALQMIQCCEIDQLVDPRLGYGSAPSSSETSTKRTVDLVAEVAFRCLQPEQDVRPAISEVLDVLRDAQNRMEKAAGAKVDVDAPLLKKSSDCSPDTVTHQWISPSTTTTSNNST